MMCQGLTKAIVALGLLRLGAPPPPVALSSEAQRYAQRYACFEQLVRPAPLAHAQFVEAMDVRGARCAAYVP